MTYMELKLEALKLAKERLDLIYHESKETSDIVIRQYYESQKGINNTPSTVKQYLDSLKPMMYTVQDIINDAEKIFAFIIREEKL